MTIALTKEVEAFVEEQIRAGICPDSSTLVNDVLRSLSENRKLPFAPTGELGEWLLEATDNPTTPLIPTDFEGIRQRVTSSNVGHRPRSGC